MEIITNEKLVKRNARLGQITSILALLILAGGMIISFTKPALFTLSMISLIVGFFLSQVGIYYGNRWGRHPRPDEVLSASLKGLDDRFALYNYTTATSHLLVGPAGVWVLIPHHQNGLITYDPKKKRWNQKGGNLYLKIFAQDGMGRPDLEISAEVDAIKKYLGKLLPDENPAIQAALVFTSDKAEVNADEAPSPTMHAKKLKDYIRKQTKEKPYSTDKSAQIRKALE